MNGHILKRDTNPLNAKGINVVMEELVLKYERLEVEKNIPHPHRRTCC